MTLVRKLSAIEADKLTHHLCRLSLEERRLRFGHGVSDQGLTDFVEAIDWSETWAIGAVEGQDLHGVVELRRAGAWWTGAAELSVSVEGPYQNEGLGTRLVAEALLVARNRGIRTVFLLCLPENRPIQRIAKKFSGRLTMVDGDLEARIQPAQPTPLTVMMELFNDTQGIVQSALEQAAKAPARSGGR